MLRPNDSPFTIPKITPTLILKTTIIKNNYGNASSAFIPSDSKVDNVPPKRNKTNNVIRLLSFISHPNGTILRVLNRKRSTSLAAAETKMDAKRCVKKQQHIKQLKHVQQHTPFEFISHPTGIVFRVLNRKQSRTRSTFSKETAMATEKQLAMAMSTMEMDKQLAAQRDNKHGTSSD